MNNNLNNNQNLDNPLVVHNKNDASYYNSTENNQMNETLVIEDENTLKRHRFKKDKSKKNNKWIALLVIFVVLAGVFCALYFTGNITFGEKETTTTQETTTEQTTTSLADAYKGTIVIKDTYIFVDGIEVEGIQGLQDSLRILEPSATAYVIINDDANSQFLNDEILPVLLDMGFYNEETDIKRKSTPNLVPSTTAPPVQEETSEEVTE